MLLKIKGNNFHSFFFYSHTLFFFSLSKKIHILSTLKKKNVDIKKESVKNTPKNK